MIQVIMGKKGSGKTKRLIDQANDALKVEHGSVVFIDDDTRYMYDLRHEIRFVDASDYKIASADMFYGFVSGMLSMNFDISVIFVDAFVKMVNADMKTMEPFFARLEELSKARNVNFVISISGDPAELPEFITRYAI
ncbi:MAG TPA: twitching motility protein PilT [Candidatus Faecaligallichristensenella faecipullorum]|nr:twitching motility protein PilT [Candidatus Faecaligallichristensenella faecipullorum]